MGEIAIYANLNNLFFIRLKTIKIGNMVSIYLGSPEKVPVDIIMAKFIKANIK